MPAPEDLFEDLTDAPGRLDGRPSERSLAALLSAAAIAFFVVYGTTVLIEALPARPDDPHWQQLVVAVLLNNVGFPLIGLAMISLAGFLLPEQPLLARWTRRVQQLALAAALLLLLLIPLNGWATLRGLEFRAAAQAGELRQAEQRYAALRQVILAARSPEELQRQLARQDGPQLNAADLARPLPTLQQDLLQGLGQARRSANQQLGRLAPDRIWTAIVSGLRFSVIAAAMAFAFAAGSRRPGAEETLLVEWADALGERRRLKELRRSAEAIAWVEEREEREEFERIAQLRRVQEEARRREIRQQEEEDEELERVAQQEMERQQRLRWAEQQRRSSGEPETGRPTPREEKRLWTLNKEFDAYYEEITPGEDDPSPRP